MRAPIYKSLKKIRSLDAALNTASAPYFTVLMARIFGKKEFIEGGFDNVVKISTYRGTEYFLKEVARFAPK